MLIFAIVSIRLHSDASMLCSDPTGIIAFIMCNEQKENTTARDDHSVMSLQENAIVRFPREIVVITLLQLFGLCSLLLFCFSPISNMLARVLGV